MFSVLKDNGYPKTFLHNCCKPVTSLYDISMEEESTGWFVVVLYTCGVMEPTKRILASHYIKVAQNPFHTLGHVFSKPKDPVPREQQSYSVYSIPCKDCKPIYIRQTKCQFGTHLKEQQRAVFLCKKKKEN